MSLVFIDISADSDEELGPSPKRRKSKNISQGVYEYLSQKSEEMLAKINFEKIR